MWQIRFEKRAKKEFDNIPFQYQKRILSILPTLQINPFVGKKMKGEFYGCYNYRIWPYRIIYKIFKNVLLIVIIKIGHRQGIYK